MEKVGRSWAWNSRAEKWPHSGPAYSHYDNRVFWKWHFSFAFSKKICIYMTMFWEFICVHTEMQRWVKTLLLGRVSVCLQVIGYIWGHVIIVLVQFMFGLSTRCKTLHSEIRKKNMHFQETKTPVSCGQKAKMQFQCHFHKNSLYSCGFHLNVHFHLRMLLYHTTFLRHEWKL